MIEDGRVGVRRERNQPFPTAKRFSFVGESGAVSERTIETLVGPTFARAFAPDLKIYRRHGPLAHRRHFHDAELSGGQLRLRIEFTQRIDRIAEELDANRSFMARRPDVDDATAHRKFTDAADRIFAHVTGSEELLDQFLR